MDFWTLDAFWVAVLEPQPEKTPSPVLETSSPVTQSGGRFALERQLIEKEALYAISTLPNVRMMTYEVEFRLNEC